LDAASVADVMTVNPGESFIKTWYLRNTGEREWSGAYQWLFVGGDQMNGPSQVRIVDTVAPGGEYQVWVELIAPTAPGQYEGRWQLYDPDAQPVGPELGVRIQVSAASSEPVAAAPSAEPEARCLDAMLVTDVTVPDGAVLNPGETFTKKWRIRNSGSCDWNNALGDFRGIFAGGDQMNGPQQVLIGSTVSSGGEYEMEAALTAPTEPGQYEGRWQLHDPAGQPFGSAFRVRIAVPTASTEPSAAAPVAAAPPVTLDEGCLDAALVADVTIPDGAVMEPGETFTKIWRLRNTGTCDWSAALGNFKWVFVTGNRMSGPPQVPIALPVRAGGEFDVEMELTAPETSGQHEGRWQVQGPNGDLVGLVSWVLVEVPARGPVTAPGGAPSAGVAGVPQDVWRNINGERDRQGLYQLAYNEKLALAAQTHANDCSQRGSCSHIGSDGSDEADRARRTGYQGTVDESWVWSASAADAVFWWLDEVPPNDWHRRMLLSDYLSEVGVGVAPAPSGYFFIAVFGRTGH